MAVPGMAPPSASVRPCKLSNKPKPNEAVVALLHACCKLAMAVVASACMLLQKEQQQVRIARGISGLAYGASILTAARMLCACAC
jgi:hypothetical protein